LYVIPGYLARYIPRCCQYITKLRGPGTARAFIRLSMKCGPTIPGR
jgi:hypothetical protein